ncbi:MAG: stage II sporulation protein M [Butyrivibrio sp.]|nr:stage II sporulation protein M [Acetatifactor muris]MCM1559074.1 stage II sporulation protein M [Butyrivibrio sp.]
MDKQWICGSRAAEMKIFGKQVQTGGKNLLPVFCAGVLVGILILNIGKSTFADGTGLFDESILSGMKYMTVDGSALFYYVLRKRLFVLLVLAVLATTYLGYAVCIGAAAWYGMAAGAYVSILVLRYGLKGLLLAAAGVFPQYLLYVPALALMLGWCEGLYRAIYSRGFSVDAGDRVFWLKKVGKLGIIGAIAALGCLLEGYVNPRLLTGCLKVF